MKGYNFAYLDEQTKRMIRRSLLKAVAIPGHQIPFGSREMPLPYGWGTGGIQVTASVLGGRDVLKVIDQGADDTTNAVSIRRFFARTAGVRTTTRTTEATVIQTSRRRSQRIAALSIRYRSRNRCTGLSRRGSRHAACTVLPIMG